MVILITIDDLQGKCEKQIEKITGGKVYFVNREQNIPYENIEIMITYGLQQDWQVLHRLSNLKWIQIFQTGIEFVPLERINKQDILLTNIRNIYGTAISEYVMSIILYEIRQLERFIYNKQIKKYDRQLLTDEAGGKTIGIFGTGAVGKEVAKKAQVFHMKVLGFNSTGNPVAHFDETYTWDKKEEMVKQCDFVVMLLPLLDDTYHFLGEKEFQLMKKDAYVINVGRGPLVDQDALLLALERNDIKGAALDVFDIEPLPENSPLWEAERLILTPHLSGKTRYFYDRCIQLFQKNFFAYQKGEPLEFMIDFAKGY